MDKKYEKRTANEIKNENIHIRATRSQKDFLDMLCYETEKNKTDMIFKALEFYYNCNKNSF
jgi:hypothetical protein